MSNIRSASSKINTQTLDKLTTPILQKSHNLPGVAIISCGANLSMERICLPLESPPYTVTQRTPAVLP